ncbi:MAG: hypothetical protein ACP5P1_13525 [Acidimicrobiales bacterium]
MSAYETVRRLIDEHWQGAPVAAVQRYRDSDQRGWYGDLAGAAELAEADAPVSDEQVRTVSAQRFRRQARDIVLR